MAGRKERKSFPTPNEEKGDVTEGTANYISAKNSFY